MSERESSGFIPYVLNFEIYYTSVAYSKWLEDSISTNFYQKSPFLLKSVQKNFPTICYMRQIHTINTMTSICILRTEVSTIDEFVMCAWPLSP